MQFLYPTFLWALAALAIPIIIHLFYFRRFKKVYFTNVKFLEEIKEETSSRNKLRNILILLARLLALAAIVLAFAQPFIPQGNDVKSGNNAVSVFVDNSFSMRAENDEVPLIDIAKEKARQIIRAYSEEDKFQILTHDFEGRHQRTVSKEDALGLIDEINITPQVKVLSKVLNRQKQAIANQEENEIIYIISDYQKSINDLNVTIDTSAEINLLPLMSVQENNISIDSVWMESAVPMLNQNNKLLVKITNHGNEDAEGVRLSLIKDGQEKPEGLFNIPKNSSLTDTVNINLLKSGWHKAEFKIADYPVQFDDTYKVALNVPEEIEILSINDGITNKYLDALFKGLNLYNLVNQDKSRVDYAGLKNYDLVILQDLRDISSGLASELDNYITNGGNLLVFPGSNIDINSYNNFLNTLAANTIKSVIEEDKTVASINRDEFVFNDVFEYVNANIKLPSTKKGYSITDYQSRAEETLLAYRDGSNYLVKYVRGKGHLYLCTSPLNTNYNDLSLNAEIFVPMLYKMAIAATTQQKIAYTIGVDEVIEADSKVADGDLVYKIVGKQEFIPGQTNLGNKVLLNINNQISEAGDYALSIDDNIVGELSFNYNRKESDLSITPSEDLDALAEIKNINLLDGSVAANFSEYISQKDKGLVLWKWFLILALLFLLIETILLRLWKEH